MKSLSFSAATGAPTRGRLLDVEQITRTLAFLAGYQPASAGTAPGEGVVACTPPRPPLDGRMEREDGPEPYCTVCGSPAGIFLGHGPDWHHFRPAGAVHAEAVQAGAVQAGVRAEVYAAGHAPAIGWRYPARAACADRPGHDRAAT